MQLLNPSQLEGLYRESRSYEQQAAIRMQSLQQELSRLYDRLVQRRLSGSRVDRVRAAVSGLSDRFEALKLLLEQTRSFVEARMAGSVALHGHSQQKSDDDASVRSFAYAADIRLKK